MTAALKAKEELPVHDKQLVAVIVVDEGVAAIANRGLKDGTYEIRSSHYLEELEIVKRE